MAAPQGGARMTPGGGRTYRERDVHRRQAGPSRGRDALFAAAVALLCLALAWGLGAAYQVGFEAGAAMSAREAGPRR